MSAQPPVEYGATCNRQSCGAAAAWTVRFAFLPPLSRRYRGEPLTAFIGLVVCDGHRARLLEQDAPAIAADLASRLRRRGYAIDGARTTFELVRLDELSEGGRGT